MRKINQFKVEPPVCCNALLKPLFSFKRKSIWYQLGSFRWNGCWFDYNCICNMTFPPKEIGNRKIQASSLICSRQKYLKCTFTFFSIFECELIAGPWASKFTKKTVAIQSEKTGCVDYVEDQLNVANKNLGKYLCDEKNIWKIYAIWTAGLTK